MPSKNPNDILQSRAHMRDNGEAAYKACMELRAKARQQGPRPLTLFALTIYAGLVGLSLGGLAGVGLEYFPGLHDDLFDDGPSQVIAAALNEIAPASGTLEMPPVRSETDADSETLQIFGNDPLRFDDEAEIEAQEISVQVPVGPIPEGLIDGRIKIAIVIDDMGMRRENDWQLVNFDVPLTFAILPYGRDVGRLARAARAKGHETIIHMPMEAINKTMDPGPNALVTTVALPELKRRINWNLARFGGYMGMNNHMGSLSTIRSEVMQPLMKELARRGLYYFDSRTTSRSLGPSLARQYGVTYMARDVFLDNELRRSTIRAQFKELKSVAERRGRAIGIGHPHTATIEILNDWISSLDKERFEFVPLSAFAVLPPSSSRPVGRQASRRATGVSADK